MKIIIMISILLSLNLYSGSCSSKTYIPERAITNVDTLYEVVDITMEEIGNDIPPYYFPALVEHESCVQLCGTGYWAKRCWNPISRLKTYWDKDKTLNREEGAGLFQLTRAWYKNGTLRMDTVRDLKRKYPKELKELNWDNVYDRPDLQMKAGLLLWRSNYKILPNTITEYNRMLMADSIYNGGYKYFNKERIECNLRKGCDSDVWFDNVENMNARGTKILYGERTAYMINRNHVKDVVYRMGKYETDYENINICTDINGTKKYIRKTTQLP